MSSCIWQNEVLAQSTYIGPTSTRSTTSTLSLCNRQHYRSGFVLVQYDDIGKKEKLVINQQVIDRIWKKSTTHMDKTCLALVWAWQKFGHSFLDHSVILLAQMNLKLYGHFIGLYHNFIFFVLSSHSFVFVSICFTLISYIYILIQ